MSHLAQPLKLAHHTWVVVGDGRKALFLRNEGDAQFPNLKTANVLNAAENPRTASLGTDRPGRAHESTGARRSSYEQTDWHDIEEDRFAHDIASTLETMRAQGAFNALVVVAPPKTLAELRRSLSPAVRETVVAEIDKDLTKHPVHEIERLLTTPGK